MSVSQTSQDRYNSVLRVASYLTLKNISDKEFSILVETLHFIFTSAFSRDSWTPERIKARLQTYPAPADVLLGYIKEEPIFYLLTFSMKYQEIDDFIWLDAFAIVKKYQGNGIGTHIISNIIKYYPCIR